MIGFKSFVINYGTSVMWDNIISPYLEMSDIANIEHSILRKVTSNGSDLEYEFGV